MALFTNASQGSQLCLWAQLTPTMARGQGTEQPT